MSQHHLDDLKNALEQKGWKILENRPGNDYDISGSWVIRRSEFLPPLTIDFNGLDDLNCLPMAQSCGCSIRDRPNISLYFTKKKKQGRWKKTLDAFVDSLDSFE
jgi:hypothetical protein